MIVRPLRRFDFNFRTSLFRRGTNETITQIISHRKETLSLSEIIDYRYEERCEENGGRLGSRWGKRRRKSMKRGVHLLSPPSSPLNHAPVRSVARFGNPESIIIDSKRRQIRNGGGEGEGRAGLPGANRRNAVSIIQLKTDMYIGIRWELSQSLRLSIARRLSDDRSGRLRGTRLLAGCNALCPPFVARFASLQVWFYEAKFSNQGKELCFEIWSLPLGYF